ncbi:abasic site processing protein HMCES isoform X1 [Amyelois transitella]|uniref:abasic site processing protein HMCES isoform X1 n=1 Tax=Amyelois transitella TaxID=680683 RepID=UPI0029902D59|nr:abasic site processing protein HMCES isoform X1 [Amyelois transitella]
MCGRTGLSLNKDQVQCACSFKVKGKDTYLKPDWLPEHNNGKEYLPSYNIAPTDITPVLVSSSKYKNAAKTDRVLKPMMWGIIPPWHKGDYRSHNLSTNNCRLENLKSSKLYNPILRDGGRCIIVVEGFYEWQTTNKSQKVKQPYYIYAPQDGEVKVDEPSTWNNEFDELTGWKGVRLLLMAGLYNIWQNEEVIIYSYSVITMDSNTTLDWLHHRMPAILDTQEQIEAWLDVDHVPPDMALSYLKPVKLLSWHPVATLVNNSRNKSTECNKRVKEIKNKDSQKTLSAWFSPVQKRKSSDKTDPLPKKVKK